MDRVGGGGVTKGVGHSVEITPEVKKLLELKKEHPNLHPTSARQVVEAMQPIQYRYRPSFAIGEVLEVGEFSFTVVRITGKDLVVEEQGSIACVGDTILIKDREMRVRKIKEEVEIDKDFLRRKYVRVYLRPTQGRLVLQ